MDFIMDLQQVYYDMFFWNFKHLCSIYFYLLWWPALLYVLRVRSFDSVTWDTPYFIVLDIGLQVSGSKILHVLNFYMLKFPHLSHASWNRINW